MSHRNYIKIEITIILETPFGYDPQGHDKSTNIQEAAEVVADEYERSKAPKRGDRR